MGVVQSSVSSEAAVAGALVAGGVAYSVYRRVASDDQAEKHTGSSSDSDKAGAASGSKKGKGKKKSASAAGDKQTRDNDDVELDELVARARAEQAAKLVETEARLSASKGGIPGAFDRDATAPSSEAEGKEKKTRKKGKKAATPRPAASSNEIDSKEAPASTTPVVAPVLPAAPSPVTTEQTGTSKKQKKRKGAKADSATAAAAAGSAGAAPSSSVKASQKPSGTASMQSSQMLGMSVTLSDAPEDESWTRVSTRKKAQQAREAAQTDPELLTSDTNLTSGVTDPEYTEEDEGSAQEPENRRTFAERMLPRPRKTGVEDMEDEPLQPSLARVIRVKPAGDEKPAKGFSWGDYEEYAHGDDGTSADGDADDVWEEVKSKKKKLDRSISGMASSADSLPLGNRSSAQEPTTKRQRQNADKRDTAKALKDAQEKERLERLAQHKRELERSRIAEQYSSSSSKKNVSGGMKASVDGGKLVWD